MMNKILVWDPLVRLLHWILAILVIANFLNEDGKFYHRWIGYTATAIVVMRIIWGFVGTKHARFSDWFPTPSRVVEYTRLKLKGQAPRYIGHNPLGAVMMLLLIVLVLNQGLTGFMMGTDQFFGEKWLEEWHEIASNLILVAIGLHVLGAIFESIKTRENLPLAMIHGKKRPHGHR
ncbi:MAG: cytochrome b/b6 domain-containing protein [Burkholderiales bacterium]|nr:cytochrome b/b6 domain-containing protein [Burkholderiales bacterium]